MRETRMSTNNHEQFPVETEYARIRRNEGLNMFVHLARQARTEVERQRAEFAALAKEIDDDASPYVARLGTEQAVNLRERMNRNLPFNAYFLLNDKTSQEMHNAFTAEAQLPSIDTEASDFSSEETAYSFEGTENYLVRKFDINDDATPYAVHYELGLDQVTLPH
jgi:23S rRNA pseudoU1915 N3-methylase RlmH